MDQKAYSFLQNLVNDSINELGGIDEITATSATPGYETPNAFSDDESRRKRKMKKAADSVGYNIVKEELDTSDLKLIKILIRDEVAEIFKNLWLKRGSWRR